MYLNCIELSLMFMCRFGQEGEMYPDWMNSWLQALGIYRQLKLPTFWIFWVSTLSNKKAVVPDFEPYPGY